MFTFPRRLVELAYLLVISSSVVRADNGALLKSCLTAAGVTGIVSTDSQWASVVVGFNYRYHLAPACVAQPKTEPQIAASLACAKTHGVQVGILGGHHSFVSSGFGFPGNLVVDLGAFQSVTYNAATKTATVGSSARIGPVMKYLWDNYKGHIPHARGPNVGLVGSALGGAFGSTSRMYGITMDTVVGVRYMVADGSIHTAAGTDDLFWAARGAGASFGIILDMTFQVQFPPPSGVSYTIDFGNITLAAASQVFVVLQEFFMNTSPDTLAFRMSHGGPPFSGFGFYYADPNTFNSVINPLITKLKTVAPATALTLVSTLDFWALEIAACGPDMDQPEGGALGGRSFYIQSLTFTTAHLPSAADWEFFLTNTQFKRTDIGRSGFIDYWGGHSKTIKDTDTSYQHGNNMLLLRFEGDVKTPAWPADANTYLKSLMVPFEQRLVAEGIPLRGFANYRDSLLTEPQWSSRLFGPNYARLKSIKQQYDPGNMFSSAEQCILAGSGKVGGQTAPGKITPVTHATQKGTHHKGTHHTGTHHTGTHHGTHHKSRHPKDEGAHTH